jgi:hypothetical protein
LDNYYQILKLKPGATLEEVKRAHRKLVKVWHPDRFSRTPRLMELAQEKLKEINLAYEHVLSNCSSSGTQTSYSKPSTPTTGPPEEHSADPQNGTYAAPEQPAQEENLSETIARWQIHVLLIFAAAIGTFLLIYFSQ